MAIKITPLTDTQVKSIKPLDKDKKYFDGGGLFLLVKKSGFKVWRFKYKRPYDKKEDSITFGSYPEITLQQARKMRDEVRALISESVDPKEHKKEQQEQQQEKLQNTFSNTAEHWFNIEKSKGYVQNTLYKKWVFLTNHIFPTMGDIPITNIKPSHIITALQPLKAVGKLSTIKRTCQIVNNVMTYAINRGLLTYNPLANITSAFDSPVETNRPTIKREELPQFMKALSLARVELQTRCVIEWQLLTMTRPSEAVGAKWEEIDIDNKLWNIPAERMKMDKPHTVTLSKQAIQILNIMKPISGSRVHVFPSMKPPYNKPMNSSTANTAIKRMGYKDRLVAHGLRALASTVLNEQGFNYDVIESALAHTDTNTVRRAYNRATYLEQRRIMLDWWGDFIEQASNGNVSLSGTKSFKVVNG